MPQDLVFRVVRPDATPEELAAIRAALDVVQRERAEAAARARPGGDGERIDAWVRVSRLTARRTGMLRGPWRLSRRIDRRSRA